MKPKIFDVEVTCRNLKNKLNKTTSTQFKLLSLSDFLLKLSDTFEYEKCFSYFFEFRDIFYDLIRKREFGYLPPENIENLLRINQLFRDILSSECDEKNFSLAENILKDERRKILTILGEDNYDSDSIYNHSPSADSLYIVLVEKNEFEDNLSDYLGVIHHLNLSSSILEKSEKTDRVVFKNLVDLNETEIVEYLHHIANTTKDEISKLGIPQRNYSFTFFFEEKNFIYTGSSLGIGAIALAYNAILLRNEYPFYYCFSDNTVFTSEVDCKGNLLKLDNDVLQCKLKTVFYSPFKNFVIPEDNITEAKEYLTKLQAKYPNRNLNPIPLRNYESLFKNTDVTEKHNLTRIQKIRYFYIRHQNAVITFSLIVSIILITLIIFNIVIPKLDRNPIDYGYANNKYFTVNKHGIKIWESKELEYNNEMEFKTVQGKVERAILTDLDSDGTSEFVYLARSEKENEISRSVFCSNPEINNFPYTMPHRHLNYPNDPVEHFSIKLQGIFLLDCNKDGTNEIIYYGRHTQVFPGVIGVLDNTGKLISEFWNEGMPLYIRIMDFNEDGREEIFWGGCNNRNDSIECAALIIFDPEHIKGSSPYTDPFGTGAQGIEEYYIIFPRSVLLEISMKERNDIHFIVKNENKTFTAFTIEHEAEPGVGLMYVFDKDMKVIKVDAIDGFKKMYTKLREETINNLPELNVYLKELQSKVRYWDGDKFVYYLAVNKHYLLAKNKNY